MIPIFRDELKPSIIDGIYFAMLSMCLSLIVVNKVKDSMEQEYEFKKKLAQV